MTPTIYQTPVRPCMKEVSEHLRKYFKDRRILGGNLVVSVSGGRTSGRMAALIKSEYSDQFDNVVYIFANTGKEREETLVFVDQIDKHLGLSLVWVEAAVIPERGRGTKFNIVDFKTASRKGEPFEEVIKKYGIPNKKYPHCTRELKQAPIHSYVTDKLGWKDYTTAIGIRADEIDRVSANYEALRLWYPLADRHIIKNDINRFWSKMPFNLNLKPYEGNCDFCWKKSLTKLMKIASENPALTEWWDEMEQKYGLLTFESRGAITDSVVFGRENRSIKFIRELAASNRKASGPDLFEFGCSESCEPF